MTRVAIYTRVSTQEQVQDGYSIGEQKERLTAYCKALGWHIVNTYTDAGYSGAKIDRPGLQSMIADIGAKKIDKVVVYRLDRLSRSQKDALYLIEDVFLKNGVDFISMSENFDTGSAFGRAMIGILAVFAQLERESIKERLMMGKQAKVSDGYWIGSVAPFGYEYTDGRLVLNESDAPLVKEIFDLFTAGTPIRSIETQFNEKGYTMRGKPWMLFTIRYILANKVYAGYLRTPNGWTKGNHEPIVTESEYDAAAKQLSENSERWTHTNFQSNGDTHSTLLGGMLYCSRCGARFGKRYVSSGRTRHWKYCCYSRMKSISRMVKDPNCKNDMYRPEDLEQVVFDEIRKLKIEPQRIDDIRAASRKLSPQDNKKTISKQLKQVNDQISRFMDLYGLGRFSYEQLDEKITPLEEQRQKLQEQLESIPSGPSLTADDAKRIVDNFDDILASGDRAAIRQQLETLINRIDIDGDTIQITWRFA